jgi:hypothetical protein
LAVAPSRTRANTLQHQHCKDAYINIEIDSTAGSGRMMALRVWGWHRVNSITASWRMMALRALGWRGVDSFAGLGKVPAAGGGLLGLQQRRVRGGSTKVIVGSGLGKIAVCVEGSTSVITNSGIMMMHVGAQLRMSMMTRAPGMSTTT